jgi:hypothetical protein
MPTWINFAVSCNAKMLVNVIYILSILLQFGIFYDHLVYFEVILVYIFSRFGTLYQGKSCNPVPVADFKIIVVACETVPYITSEKQSN